ncbi:MAG TPA: hypothetical protein VJA21_08235, partial [Verrucomicrobiae bacterium]
NLVGSVTSAPAALVVSAPSPIRVTIAQDNSVTLSWSGGVAPYQVESTTNLVTSGWLPLGAPTTNRSVTFTPAGQRAFYRVRGQ